MTKEQFRQWTALWSEPVLLVARDGSVIAASRELEGLGLSPEAVVAQPLASLVETSAERVENFLKMCSRVREPVVGAMRLRRTDGDVVDCECRGMRAPTSGSADGPTLLIRLTAKAESTRRYALLEEKIAELNAQVRRRMELELELKERNEYLQVTLSSIGDGVIVTDAQGCVTMLNLVAEGLTGWKTEDAKGLPLEGVFNIVNQSTRSPVENPVFKALREGVVVGLANHTVLIAKDGSERPIDDSAAAILDGRGTVLGAVLVFRDISDRYKAQAELRDQSALFMQLADAIPQLAWMAQPDGKIDWYNGRWYEYTGATPEQMARDGWMSFHDPVVLPAVIERWTECLNSGEPLSMVFPLRGADGQYRAFLTKVMPLRNAEGAVMRWFGTNTDISEQKKLEDDLRSLAARLADANRRKDEFLAILAHELRNPLAPIRTGLELLKIAGDDAEQREETRSVMERQTVQLISLVDDLLDVSRITRGKLELRKRRVELAEVLSNAIESSRPILDEGGHRLEMSWPGEAIMVEADPNRLAQVFANLLNNAAKYTAPGGKIRIQTERRDSVAVVAIRDDGIGIPRDKLADIFEMFMQIDSPQERGQTGLGIGLTLVKTLVELHGGSIAAESEGRGKGSVFTVSLPILVEEAVRLDGRAGSIESAGVRGEQRRVLVVDDNRAAAKMLSILVQIHGHEVKTAHDGREALKVAADFRPEVILMDLGMPHLNGFEAAQELRRNAWGRDVLLVAVSGWGQEEDRRRTREAGFNHHLVKPVDPETIKTLLARS